MLIPELRALIEDGHFQRGMRCSRRSFSRYWCWDSSSSARNTAEVPVSPLVDRGVAARRTRSTDPGSPRPLQTQPGEHPGSRRALGKGSIRLLTDGPPPGSLCHGMMPHAGDPRERGHVAGGRRWATSVRGGLPGARQKKGPETIEISGLLLSGVNGTRPAASSFFSLSFRAWPPPQGSRPRPPVRPQPGGLRPPLDTRAW